MSSGGKRITKSRWSNDEDDKLRKLVDDYGADNFQKISTYFSVRLTLGGFSGLKTTKSVE